MGKNNKIEVGEVRRDYFLESILKKPVYQMDSDVALSPKYFSNGTQSFIYAKISFDDYRILNQFQEVGFEIVELNLQFEKSTLSKTSFETGTTGVEVQVRWAANQDRSEVVEIAKDSFKYSRFHLDRNIDNKVANCIKETWAENFFKGKRGDKMAVATIDDKVVGFIQILTMGNSFYLDLVAVSGSHQKSGIALQMIEFVFEKLSYKDNCFVGTQASNLPSIRFYQKIGFKVFKSNYVLHYHGEFDGKFIK